MRLLCGLTSFLILIFLINTCVTVTADSTSDELTLMESDILNCVSDTTYICVYTSDDASKHSFSIPILNGEVDAQYQVKMKIQDLDTQQIVFEGKSDNGTFDLLPHESSVANWNEPFSSWYDGHTYNISFFSIFSENDSRVGNEIFYEIQFYDQIDVAILSNETDLNRLQQVKADLEVMGMTYTQFEVEDWEEYVTPDWIEHYNKVLLPWQTDYNVVYGDYYEIMDNRRETDGISVVDVLENFMIHGGTVQMHLGPYENEYEPGRLIFDMLIEDRNQYNMSIDNRIKYEDISIDDPYHPILSGIEKVTFSGIHAGDYVAISGIDVASQVQANQIPATCGGRISVTGGTFHTLMRDTVQGHSLMSVCNKGAGGLIVTTIDVENPSVSELYGGENIPLLSNMLSYHLTPYPLDFGIAGTDFELIINDESVDINPTTGVYRDKYIKSNADLEFTYTSEVEGLIADWVLESGNDEPVNGWDGELLNAGMTSHRNQVNNLNPLTNTFCANSADETCRVGAIWSLTLYVHDDSGHTRITNIRLIANDTLADDFYPISAATIVHDPLTSEFIVPAGTKSIGGVDWPVYIVRLSNLDNETTIKFTGENSSDADAPQGESGIALYEWRVINDMPVDDFSGEQHVWQNPAALTVEWSYTFRNITVSSTIQRDVRVELIVYDIAGKQTKNKYRMYFMVIDGKTSDIDGDGWLDSDEDDCNTDWLNPSDSPSDYDMDMICDSLDNDDDGDGYSDADENNNCGEENNPLDATSMPTDTDYDLVCNLLDLDDDGDGVNDTFDIFPLDSTETADYDSDGIGNNADTDDDNDLVLDLDDVFPYDSTESVDTDDDGIGNNADTDDDNDLVLDLDDAFPYDSTESVDTDDDGIGNNADTDDDNDGWLDTMDVRPLDSSIQTELDIIIVYIPIALGSIIFIVALTVLIIFKTRHSKTKHVDEKVVVNSAMEDYVQKMIALGHSEEYSRNYAMQYADQFESLSK